MTFIFSIARVFVNLGNIFSINSPHYPMYIIAYIFAESGIMIYLAAVFSKRKNQAACVMLILYYIASRAAVLGLLYLHGFFIQSGLAADIFVVVLYSLLMLPGAVGASSCKKLLNAPGYPAGHLAGHPAPYCPQPPGPGHQQPYPAPQQPYPAPQQPYPAPQQPYPAPQQPYYPQPPGPGQQQPYPAPQQPYCPQPPGPGQQ